MSDYNNYGYNNNDPQSPNGPYSGNFQQDDLYYQNRGYPPYNAPQGKKPKKEHKTAKLFGKVIAIALVFGLLSGVTFQGVGYAWHRITGDSAKIETNVSSDADSAKSLSRSGGTLDSTAVSTATTVTDVSDIVENTMPAIVQVTNMSVVEYQTWFGQTMQYEGESAGSGIIISQDDDYIYVATNNHVVSNSNSLTITFCDDTAVSAELQGTYPEADLAVVKVAAGDLSEDTLSAIKVATVGNSDDLIVGESAIVIGNALGYGQSVTTGVISALSREVELQNDDGSIFKNTLIQTDAAINPGNSGGALLNMNGEVVGIVSAKYSDTAVEGMGYAIPISSASEIIEQLMNDGKVTEERSQTADEGNGAYLGIAGVDVDETMAQQYNMPVGIYVSQVISGSGAEEAGLEKGDIITAFNDRSISHMEQLQSEIAALSPGDSVTLRVASVRDQYEEFTIEVTLGEK